MTVESPFRVRLQLTLSLVLAALWLVLGSLDVLDAMVGVFSLLRADSGAGSGSWALLGVVGFFVLLDGLLGALMLVLCVGIVRRRPWAVWLGILASVNKMASFPVGVGLGAASMVGLLYLWRAGYFRQTRAVASNVGEAA